MTSIALTSEVQSAQDYFQFFFLRSKADGSVAGVAPNVPDLVSQTMSADGAAQLFGWAALPTPGDFAAIIHKQTGQALVVQAGKVRLAAPTPSDPAQQWALTATNQLTNASTGSQVATLRNGGYVMAAPTAGDTSQMFDQFFPLDFVYVRNCWSGKYLTVAGPKVVWGPLDPSQDLAQQWGITPDGLLISRASGAVLQPAGNQPVAGALLALAPQRPLGSAPFQQFDLLSMDNMIHSVGGEGLVIAKRDTDALLLACDHTDAEQLIEFISPFQFFTLQNGGYLDQNQPFFQRYGDDCMVVPYQSRGGDPHQLFTVSRYGELISPLDGHVMQCQGERVRPKFVDPEPEGIGFDTTTFQYNMARAVAGWGVVQMRSANMGLIVAGERYGAVPEFFGGIKTPANGNQVWRLVGVPGSVFTQYQDIAIAFFADPAPLPGQGQTIDAHLAPSDLTTQLDKTTKVIIALVAGVLDIAAGVSVGSVTDQVAARVAQVVLGEASVAAKVAVIMQGTVTAASIIAVADGITRAGLWYQLFKLLLPNSFWGWTLTIAKLGLTIAAWVVGAGPAITGAKIALLCADIIRILAENAAQVVKEAALLAGRLAQLDSERRLEAILPAPARHPATV